MEGQAERPGDSEVEDRRMEALVPHKLSGSSELIPPFTRTGNNTSGGTWSKDVINVN